jgi:hypothetical protein
MEVKGQLYDPVALPSGTEPTVLIEQEAGWALESVWTAPAENRTPVIQLVAQSLCWLSYPGSLNMED